MLSKAHLRFSLPELSYGFLDLAVASPCLLAAWDASFTGVLSPPLLLAAELAPLLLVVLVGA